MPGLSGEVANLIVALRLDDKGFSGKLNGIARQLKGMDAGLSQVGRGVGQVGSGLARLGTVAAVGAAAGLGAVITTAASFEQAFTGVEKTVDGTDAQLAELEQTFRQMARTIPVSFEELASIGEAGGALGIARADLADFTDVVARLSVSTNLSSDQAATALGQLGNVLHLSGGEFRDFADSLVALGNAGASTEDQIVELASRFAAAGNAAGLSKEEILAISSAVASMGIEVEAGGTALSQTFNGITTAIGTSSSEVNAFTDTLGISAAEFKERWTRDALGTFQDFLRELGKVDKFKQADILQRAGITGVRQVNAVMLMTQNLGLFNDQLAVSEGATGALNKESQKFFDTTAGKWKVLQQNVKDAAATIGTELLPIVNDLITEFDTFLQTPGAQAGLKDFAKDLAGGIRDVVKELKGTDFSGLIGGMKIAAEVAKGAFNAFRALPEPIQQLAIAALVANKVSGGAVGSIAKGLGNIVLGSLKIAFERGASPANPLWVQSVTGGVGGGGAGGAPATPLAGLIPTIATVAAGVAAGTIIASPIFEKTVAPARTFEAKQFADAIGGGASLADVDRTIATLEAQLKETGSNQTGVLALGASKLVSLVTGQESLGDALIRQLSEAKELRARIIAANAARDRILNSLPFGFGKALKPQSDAIVAATNRTVPPLVAQLRTHGAALAGIRDAANRTSTATNTSALLLRTHGVALAAIRDATNRTTTATNTSTGLLRTHGIQLAAIAAKKTSFIANVFNTINTTVSASAITTAVRQTNIIRYDTAQVGL